MRRFTSNASARQSTKPDVNHFFFKLSFNMCLVRQCVRNKYSLDKCLIILTTKPCLAFVYPNATNVVVR